MKQRDVFSEGEGDAWFEQNTTEPGDGPDEVEQAIDALQIRPERILEIGCSTGRRLEKLRVRFNAECAGIDAQGLAVAFAD